MGLTVKSLRILCHHFYSYKNCAIDRQSHAGSENRDGGGAPFPLNLSIPMLWILEEDLYVEEKLQT